MDDDGFLARIERYYDALPRADADVEQVGDLTLFVGSGPWSYYARPRLGAAAVGRDDVEAVRTRMRELDLPESFEWVAETTRSMRAATAGSRLSIVDGPLLVAADPVDVMLPGQVRLILIGADEPRLIDYLLLAARAFADAGHLDDAVSEDDRARAAAVEHLRQRIQDGNTVLMAAVLRDQPLAVGAHQPVEAGDELISEIVGVATVPDYRHRGLGAAMTSALVTDAQQDCSLVFLSTGDDDGARSYERIGFARVGTVCSASG